ncbi:uncharacterized protein TrAtP1_009764 [Trichoderma atroviride]|uniref:uncharacterized protein n=1 Tax=Hypocrea atroviridis TaxID=63577 RepID=UPI0033239BC3|nr:hypothetical protein TrAtP1_009764 [Trichoderma atroviride]
MMILVNGSDNEDGSDAEINEASDDEEENEITVVEDDESESEDTAWSPEENSALDDQGIDYVVDLDIRSRSDHDVEERDPPDDRSGYSSLPRSLIPNQDEADVPNEMNTPNETDVADVTANESENEARERNMNPEQPSPLNSHLSGGKSTSVEEQLVQRAPTIISEFQELMVESDIAAKNTKIINDEIEENVKEMNQVVRQILQCNNSASSEDFIAAVIPVFSNIAEQQRKRKMEEKNIENIDVKKAKLLHELAAKTHEVKVRFQADI